MKNIKNIVTLLVVGCFALALVSCNKKESADIASITSFPIMELNGSPHMNVGIGETFTDPGVTVTVDGADVPYTTVGTVNTTAPGLYTIVYSATDLSGNWSQEISRQVYVCDDQYIGFFALQPGGTNVANRTGVMYISKVSAEKYRASNIWWQAALVPVNFEHIGGGIFNTSTGNTSNYGNFDGTVLYNAGTETFSFDMTFTSGNTGVNWKTNYKRL